MRNKELAKFNSRNIHYKNIHLFMLVLEINNRIPIHIIYNNEIPIEIN